MSFADRSSLSTKERLFCVLLRIQKDIKFHSRFLQVRRDCGGEFKKNSIPLPVCSWIYPDEDGPNGLCQLSVFPVPWPSRRTDGKNPLEGGIGYGGRGFFLGGGGGGGDE